MKPPVPVEQAIIYYKVAGNWRGVRDLLKRKTGYYWQQTTIYQAVRRYESGIRKQDSVWNDENVNELKKLWGDGLSASQCGLKLGLSRNSVMGKIHRLRLSGRVKMPSKSTPKPKKERIAKAVKEKKIPFTFGFRSIDTGKKPPSFPKLTSDEKEALQGKGIDFEQLESHHCRWIITDFPRWGKHLYCGKTKFEGSPYCDCHTKLAWARTPGSAVRAAQRELAQS